MIFPLSGTPPSLFHLNYHLLQEVFSHVLLCPSTRKNSSHFPLCHSCSLYLLLRLFLTHHIVTWVFICLLVCVLYPRRTSAHLIPFYIPVLRWCQVLVLLGNLRKVSPTTIQGIVKYGHTVRGDRMVPWLNAWALLVEACVLPLGMEVEKKHLRKHKKEKIEVAGPIQKLSDGES